jgi:hypothetical protein
MVDDGKGPDRENPANDNRPAAGQNARSESDASERLNRVVLDIARFIGRRMARKDFAAGAAANENVPKSGDGPAGGADKA